MEITFVNKEDIFQYYNDSVPADEMILNGRRVKWAQCRAVPPPKFLEKVLLFKELREGKRDKFVMWFSRSRGENLFM